MRSRQVVWAGSLGTECWAGQVSKHLQPHTFHYHLLLYSHGFVDARMSAEVAWRARGLVLSVPGGTGTHAWW